MYIPHYTDEKFLGVHHGGGGAWETVMGDIGCSERECVIHSSSVLSFSSPSFSDVTFVDGRTEGLGLEFF